MSRPAKGSDHIWKVSRLGGLDQVLLESGDDLLALEQLDPKLWVALSCPIQGLEIDERTLALIDSDGDGHIRIPEIIAAIRWAAVRLKDAGDLLKGSASLPLAAISETSEEGRKILAEARQLLGRIGGKDAAAISAGDISDPAKVFLAGGVAGDGVIAPAAAANGEVRTLIEDIIACLGGEKGKAGQVGVTAAQAAVFFAETDALAAAAAEPSSFLPYPGWVPAKARSPLEKLPPARLAEARRPSARAGLEALFAQDRALAPEWEALAQVDRLARYLRDLRDLLHNFVNFSDFYSKGRMAAFQSGTLYLDSRSCELCIRVEDPAAHAALAAMSKLYIAYMDCRRPGGEAMKLAACVTQGDSDYLFVGRNGLFYDRRGRDWDATITKIIDNPISVREAFFSPYKKFLRLIESQLVQRTAAASGGPPVVRPKFDVGTVAALGVAVGGLSAAFGSVITALVGHRALIPVVLLGVVLAISGPSVLIAWFKLRQRNLGPMLEANGWAVNSRVKINPPLGRALTGRAALPAGARRQGGDPYADRAAVWRRWIYGTLAVLLIAALIAARHLGTWPFDASDAPSTPATRTAPSGR